MTIMKDPNDSRAAAHAYAIICDGGLVVAKASVGYSFICTSDDAASRIYALKGRPPSRRCVALTTPSHLPEMCHVEPSIIERLTTLAKATPIAAILPVKDGSRFLANFGNARWPTLIEEDAICVYLGGGAFFDLLSNLTCSAGYFALGSSANFSNHGNAFRFEDIPQTIIDGVDLAIDSGPAEFANEERHGGTIVNLVPGRMGVKRAGINAALILDSLSDLLVTKVM